MSLTSFYCQALSFIAPEYAAKIAYYNSPEVQKLIHGSDPKSQFSRYRRQLRMDNSQDALPPDNFLDSADITDLDWTGLRAEMRRLVDEDSLAGSIVQTLVDNTVGPKGPSFQSRSGDAAYDKDVEAWWNSIKDSLDCRRVSSFADLVSIIEREAIVAGDVLPLPLVDGTLQLCEAEQCETPPGRSADVDVSAGVQFDSHGRPLNYFLGSYDPRSGRIVNHEPFPAEKVFFYGKLRRPSALRGFPALYSSLANLRDLEDYLGAEKARAKFSSLFGLKLYAESNAQPASNPFDVAPAALRGVAQANAPEAVPKAPSFRLGKLTNVQLPRGWNAEFLESKAPSPQLSSFVDLISRYAGLGAGPIPLEFVLLDFSRGNFSNTRAAWQAAYKTFLRRQCALAVLLRRILAWRYRFALAAKELSPKPGSGEGYVPPCDWIFPGYQYLNPREEIAANGEALDRCLLTLKDIHAQDGRDWQEVLLQRKAEYDFMRSNQIPFTIAQPGSNVSGLDKTKEPERKP